MSSGLNPLPHCGWKMVTVSLEACFMALHMPDSNMANVISCSFVLKLDDAIKVSRFMSTFMEIINATRFMNARDRASLNCDPRLKRWACRGVC